MSLFNRNKTNQQVKEEAKEEIMGIFAIAVIIILVAAVIVLRILGVDPYEDVKENSLEELMEQFGYDDESIAEQLKQRLGEEAIQTRAQPFAARDGKLRTAYISKPEGERAYAAVILLHGTPAGERVTQRLSRELGERLAEDAGVLTVAVDWRDSDFGDGDLNDAVSVLEATEKYTEDRSKNVKEPILYVGVDHGAYLALLAAAEEDERVSGVAAISGYWNLATQYESLLETDPDAAANFLRESGCDIAIDSDNCLAQRSLSEDTLQSVRSLLWIHHENDPLVSVDQAVSASVVRAAADEEYTETTVYTLNTQLEEEGTTPQQYHQMLSDSTGPLFDEAYAVLLDWVNDQLNPTLTIEETEERTTSVSDPLEIEIE